MNQGVLRSAWSAYFELAIAKALMPGLARPSWLNLYFYHRGILQRRFLAAMEAYSRSTSEGGF